MCGRTSLSDSPIKLWLLGSAQQPIIYATFILLEVALFSGLSNYKLQYLAIAEQALLSRHWLGFKWVLALV